MATTLTLTAAAQTRTINEIFTFPNYTFAFGGMTVDSAGNLYGTTDIGGTGTACGHDGCGTVFELSPTSRGWTETVLYNFADGSDGENPITGVVFDAAGNLYGTTRQGGSASCVPCATFDNNPVGLVTETGVARHDKLSIARALACTSAVCSACLISSSWRADSRHNMRVTNATELYIIARHAKARKRSAGVTNQVSHTLLDKRPPAFTGTWRPTWISRSATK